MAGYSATLRVAALKGKVALIEKNRLGGQWIWNGRQAMRNVLKSMGYFYSPDSWVRTKLPSTQQLSFPVQDLLKFARETSEIMSSHWQAILEGQGAQLIQGVGKILGPDLVSVETPQGKEILKTRTVILAAGSVTREPNAMPFDEKYIISGDNLLTGESLPEHLLLAGGQAEGFEWATILNRLGCKVFLSEKRDRLVEILDQESNNCLEEALRLKKLKLLLRKNILSINKINNKVNIMLDGGIRFSVNKVVVCGDRKPQSICCLETGVRVGEYGEIWVDESLQTSETGIYAIGSIIRQRRDSRLSEEEARVVAGNVMGKDLRLNPDRIPYVIYGDPEVAGVGVPAEEAHHKGFGRGIEGRCGFGEVDGVGGGDGMASVVAEQSSRKVIGGRIVGPDAIEALAPIFLAIRKELTVSDLARNTSGWSRAGRAVQQASRVALKTIKTLNA